MKLKLKEFPIPWRFSNSDKWIDLDRGQTYTHYIKEPGQGISIYSSDFVKCEGEEKIIKYYKKYLSPTLINRVKCKLLIGYMKLGMWFRKVVWKFMMGE